MPREPGAVRALSAALALMDQARAWKHDKDLSSRLTDRAVGLLGHDAVLTITGPQNAGKLPDCGAPAREQVVDLAGVGDAGIGTVIRGARARVMAWPAAGDLRGEEDEQA